MTLTAPKQLQLSVEVWLKGNSLTGVFISATANGNTILTCLKTGSDLSTNDFGGSLVFPNAFNRLSSSDWNLLGISIGLLGSSTNGMVCLWVGNNADS